MSQVNGGDVDRLNATSAPIWNACDVLPSMVLAPTTPPTTPPYIATVICPALKVSLVMLMNGGAADLCVCAAAASAR